MNQKLYRLLLILAFLVLWNSEEGIAQQNYTLTVTKTGSGNGTVTSSPSGINCGTSLSPDCLEVYASGKRVTLRAKPDANSIFTGWSGGECLGTKPCKIIMEEDATVAAGFVLKVPDIEIFPEFIDFGEVEIGKRSVETFTISNPGTDNLITTLSGLEETEFGITGRSEITVKPKNNYVAKVKFSSKKEGSKNAKIRVNHNVPGKPPKEVEMEADVVPLVPIVPHVELEITKEIIFDLTEPFDFYLKITVPECWVTLKMESKSTYIEVTGASVPCEAKVWGASTHGCASCQFDGTADVGVVVEPTSVLVDGVLSLDMQELWLNTTIKANCMDTCKNKPYTEEVPIMPPIIVYDIDLPYEDGATKSLPFFGIGGIGTNTWTLHIK